MRRLGLVLFLAIVGFAIAGPMLVTADPARQVLSDALAPPSAAYWLGADHLGRSMLARLAHAAQLSLGLAVFAVATAAIPGIALGLLAAWRGGWVERLLVIVSDSVLALPGLLLVLIVATFAPGQIWPLFLGLSVVLWVEFFRLVRASVRPILAGPGVEAARLLGFGPLHIVRRHVLPVLLPVLVTLLSFGICASVIAVSALSFVSVGVAPPTPEWGNMMTELLPYWYDAPLQFLAPGLLLFVSVLSLQLLAGRGGR